MINRQIGGVKRIVKVAEIVVPSMAGAYILMALIVIALSITQVPVVFMLIFRSAFDMKPAFAGIFVMAVSWGVKRCIYSNEGSGNSSTRGGGEGRSPGKTGACSGCTGLDDRRYWRWHNGLGEYHCHVLLRKPAVTAFKDYSDQRKQGKNPVFKAKELGITNTEEWNQTICV